MSSTETAPRRRLSRTVIGLGLVSFFTDASSEIILPLLPLFLVETLGAPKTFFGFVEGAANATASLLKYLAGRWSDQRASVKPIVLGGYGLSTVMRPLMALATSPAQVLAVRVVDRIGKGIRSSPRDAMIAQATEPDVRGRAYGFHRAMDHAGAATGALLGTALLSLGLGYRTIFWIASIPGALSLVALALVREPPREVPKRQAAQRGPLPTALKKYFAVLFVFTLAGSSDTFLILKAREVGASATFAPMLWLGLHIVKAAVSTWGGTLSDRLGRVRTIVAGWVIYGVCYVVMGQMQTLTGVFIVTLVYGIYTGLTEGAEKAYVADLAPETARGTAFGFYNAVNGLGLLAAGLLFGWLWDGWNSQVAFSAAGLLALLAALLLTVLRLIPARA
jgi:MFS family permease